MRTDFNWAGLQTTRLLDDSTTTTPQVESVLNYVATADWVVAIFPKALELLHLQDLGSAGHDGFSQLANGAVGDQARYIRGTHGAAIREKNWEDIAQFIVHGTPPTNAGVGFPASQFGLVKFLGKIAPLVWVCLFGAAAALWYLIDSHIGSQYWRGGFLIAYLLLLFKLLTSL